jgi:hypothetical protein
MTNNRSSSPVFAAAFASVLTMALFVMTTLPVSGAIGA